MEAMSAARHNSVASSLTYIQRNTKSEAARFRDLNQERLPLPTLTNTTHQQQHTNPTDYLTT